MTQTVLKVEAATKTYPGVRALDNVSIECLSGEVHAILGENGSGKSTLMKLASGAVTPDSGRVEINGQLLTAADPGLAHDLGLATVYQDDSLILELTVAQNLFLGAAPGSVPYSGMLTWAAAQLEPFSVGISASSLVSDLTPAHRQFVEIVKALISKPKVLLLDEPTSTLDLEGVRKLSGIIRSLTAQGTGIIYVSHRLPEILELADRVTILRDGVHRGTFPVTKNLSEQDLVSLMVGRDITGEYPPKSDGTGAPVLQVHALSGDAFQDIALTAHAGEIVGFAGAEGNGQREALRALVGLEDARGQVSCAGQPVDISTPRAAKAGGILFLSADRKGEAIFPDLGVQKNMVLSLLSRFSSAGLLRAEPERQKAAEMKQDFGVVAASLDAPVIGLSGGNQQKTVLARSFRSGAKAILIDEPTQGVDASARHDIYRVVRENIRTDGTCIINSSDAQELAGICDRVLVFSRGRIVRELTGADVTEEKIVSSFLTVRDAKTLREADAGSALSRAFGTLVNGSSIWWVPLVFLAFLTVLVFGFAASESDVFLKPINIRHMLEAAAPVGLVAMAQLHVLLVRGLDVSVGSLMSVTVVAASYLLGSGAPVGMVALGVLACIGIGVAVGLINGLLVRFAHINAVITTIAMLSVLQGIALVIRPTPGGAISPAFMELLHVRIGFVPVSAFVLIAAVLVGDWWLHRTRSGLEVKAVGFREESARRNGVRVNRVQVRAYVLASATAAIAGLFLAGNVGVGHPTVGQNFALNSIAAAVLGGAALSGGRGSFGGALFGAFFFTLMVNVISILGLSSSVGVIASGLMTLLAIFLYSGLAEFDRGLRRMLRRRNRSTIATAK